MIGLLRPLPVLEGDLDVLRQGRGSGARIRVPVVLAFPK